MEILFIETIRVALLCVMAGKLWYLRIRKLGNQPETKIVFIIKYVYYKILAYYKTIIEKVKEASYVQNLPKVSTKILNSN